MLNKLALIKLKNVNINSKHFTKMAHTTLTSNIKHNMK